MVKMRQEPNMRRFSSYGPIDTDAHYYAPRKELVERAYSRLVGDNRDKGGHYITVWAPRQCGKTWLMQQILYRLQKEAELDVLKINLEHLKYETDTGVIISTIAKEIGEGVNRVFSGIDTQAKFQEIFKKGVLEKPLILIMDEFDALPENAINAIVSAFRNIHIKRKDEMAKKAMEKSYLLHAVSLIGVRSVLGIENAKGSPFNVQQSLHIPNLTFDEVEGMFEWYGKETGHEIEPDVIKALFDETRGQPGLTCWLGELLTEGFEEYSADRSRPIRLKEFNFVYNAATSALPNNNIVNLISKAKEENNKRFLLEMFKTGEKLEFAFDEPTINALYMNGLVDKDVDGEGRYFLRFACPLVQKRLFNYFSNTYFRELGRLFEPFSDLGDTITEESLNVRNLGKRYETYLAENHEWLLKDVPRRKDLRIYEAVFHFNFYAYLKEFLKARGGRVFPEFPTGNGKIDLLITYAGRRYGIEVKSYTSEWGYNEALRQAARYAKQLGLKEIFLAFFVERIEKKSREKYETAYTDEGAGISVKPFFVNTL